MVETVSDTSGVGVGGSSDDATTSAVHCRVGIVGDKGVGKSALFDHLKVHFKAVDTSPDSVRSCTLQGDPCAEPMYVFNDHVMSLNPFAARLFGRSKRQ